MRFLLSFALALFLSLSAFSQVSEIKRSSSSNSSGRFESGRGSSGGGNFNSYFLFNFFGNGLINWQRMTLDKREDIPAVLSLEAFAQVAVQPSTYYVFNPRVRGNWGIFYSDFRVNYMVEESIDGYKDLRTTDWQIIGLNLVNVKNVTARIGTGFMKENFAEGEVFSESVMGLSVHSADQKIGGTAEFRWARDFTTGAVPRREWSFFVQRKLFDKGALHGFATAGATFQRYYAHVNVWGLQGGFAVKLY